MHLLLQPASKDLIMKVLEQAWPNLPQKPAKLTKPGIKGASKLETLDVNDDDDAEVTLSKPVSAAADKAASKAGKPASAAGKKVDFMLCVVSWPMCAYNMPSLFAGWME